MTCTRGELGEVIPDDLERLRDDEAALAVHREGEIAAALRELGVRDHRFLGDVGARTPGLEPRVYRDSGMVWRSDGVAGPTDDLHPAAFCAAEFGEIVSDLSAVVDAVRPTVVVSYDDDGGYHHPTTSARTAPPSEPPAWRACPTSPSSRAPTRRPGSKPRPCATTPRS